MDDTKKLSDIVNYDALHLQYAIINRTSEKVQKLLKQEESFLNQRRTRLKRLLDSEERQFREQLDSLRRTEEKLEEMRKNEERKAKEEELEREKARECLKASEREKIARGMRSTKEDEVQLRLMQKMQIEERRLMEDEARNMETMWHQVLLDDFRRKEMAERNAENRRQQEMLERRRKYEEQIATAQEEKRRMLQEERDKENRRLARMHEDLERERTQEQQRKKQQQNLNKTNYIEGHKEKLARIHETLCKEHRIDCNTIQKALQEMHLERNRKYLEMKNLQKTEKIFTEMSQKEREEALRTEELANRVIESWQQAADDKAEQQLLEAKRRKENEKEKLSADYKRYIDEQKQIQAKEREARSTKMERVRRMARDELNKKVESANKEFLNQMHYRQDLNEQIVTNQKILITELQELEKRQIPFTRKPEYFRDKMMLHGGGGFDKSSGQNSTNPVHPFRRVLETKKEDLSSFSTSLLPPISRCC